MVERRRGKDGNIGRKRRNRNRREGMIEERRRRVLGREGEWE